MKPPGGFASPVISMRMSVPSGRKERSDSAIRRAQVLYGKARGLDPIVGYAFRENERAVRLPFIDEHIEHGADIVGRDPCVRHVAYKSWLPWIPPDHLGPLVPSGWALVLEEEFEQLARPLSPTEPHEGADHSEFVGRIVAPRCEAVATIGEDAPIVLEGLPQQIDRHNVFLAAGSESYGCRCGVKIPKIGGARHIADAVYLGG